MSFGSFLRRSAPVAAVVYGVLTLAVNLARAPLDSLTHQSGPAGWWLTG